MSLQQKLETQVETALSSESVKKAEEVIDSRSGTVMIAIISFLESAFPVPILTDPFLIAAILVNRTKAFRLVVVTTIASVAGGVCAYIAAAFFFDILLEYMTPFMVDEFNSMVSSNDSSAFILTLIGAVTPIPYTIVAWVVAVIEGGLAIFIAASVLGRGFRYALVGFCTYKFGPLAVSYARRYIALTSVVLVILVAFYLLLKL